MEILCIVFYLMAVLFMEQSRSQVIKEERKNLQCREEGIEGE